MAKVYILPNGKKVRVDDNIGRAGAIDIAVRNNVMTRKEAGYEDFSDAAVEGSSFGQNLLEGTGRGMANIGRNIANLAHVKGYSDEELRESNKLDEALMDTGGGMLGSAIGETVATLPLGMGVGRAATGLVNARRAAQVARGIVPGVQAGGRLGAARLAATGAAEGAGVGGLAAGPDDRGMGAAVGGLAGGAMSGLGSGLRRVREGLVKTSDEAVEMAGAAASRGLDMELPLASAAQDGGISGAMKFVYKNILPYLPGATGNLERQAAQAGREYTELVARDAAPKAFKKTLMYEGADQSRTVQDVVRDLDNFFEDGFKETVGSYKFNVGDDFLDSAMTRLNQAAGELGEGSIGKASDDFFGLIRRFSDDGVLDGSDVGRIKRALNKMGGEAQEDSLAQAYKSLSRGLDDMVADQLSIGGGKQAATDLANYQDLINHYGNFQDFWRSSARAPSKGGSFTPEQHMSVLTGRASAKDVAKGVARNQDLASIGMRTVGRGVDKPNIWGRALIIGTIFGGGGIVGGPVLPALAAGTARLLSSKGTQRALMGHSGWQRGLERTLRSPVGSNVSGATGQLLRRGTAGAAAEETR